MLKRGQWSVEDLTKLRETYGRRPFAQLVRELRRTPETVRQRAQQLFGGRLRIGELTDDERRDLRCMVGIADLETAALVLGREPDDLLRVLRGWAETRRRGRFEAWEIDYLKSCYASRPDWAVALVLGRSLPVIRKRVRDLCLGKNRRVESVPIRSLEPIVTLRPAPRARMPRWRPSEVESLLRDYPSRPNLEIAKQLGRSVKSVIAKANELGLKKSPARLRLMGRENVGRRRR